ncbi:MAG: hypothetical protein JSV12_06775 [Candidatus Bathyarchaeota archaeon]|nr:MAG: hypothetical protein JSV12_06775 [Candidatus Bathyarchaeota archaeon]
MNLRFYWRTGLFVEIDILEKLGKKEIKAENIAKNVIQDPGLLPEIFNGISSENSRIKFKSAKILRVISEENPEILYSKMDFFVNLLDRQNRILKWNAIDVIGNLTSVDSKNNFDKIFKKYYSFLSAESMITVAHVVDNSGKIAKAKPHLTEKITHELFKIEKIPRNQECKNILLGKAILAFGMFFDQIENKDYVISFVKRQLNNARNATKAKAEKILKIIE